MTADATRRRRVLAVDDEPSVTLLVSRVLQRAGFDVVTAGSGEEALEVARRTPPDLLIVDKNLPRMNGFELLKRVRTLYPSVPVIIITAAPEPFSAMNERVDGYLAKPFKSLDALRDAVHQAFERQRVAQERQDLQRKLDEVMAQLRRP